MKKVPFLVLHLITRRIQHCQIFGHKLGDGGARWAPGLALLALVLVMPLLLAEKHSDGTSWKLYSIAKGRWQVAMGTGVGRRVTVSPVDPERLKKARGRRR